MESAAKTSEIDTAPEAAQVADVACLPGLHIRFGGAARAEWDALCRDARYASYQQSYAYGEALGALGVQVLRAHVFKDGELIGVVQIATRKFLGALTLAHVMRGPVWRDGVAEECRSAAIEKIRTQLPVSGVCIFVVTLESERDDGLRAAGYRRIMTGFHTALLDLTRDDETLRAGLDGKWRNRLKAAEREDLVIAPLGRRPEKYAWLLEKDDARNRTLGQPSRAAMLAPRYQEIAGKNAVIGFEAKSGPERLAGMLFLRHGDNATYHIGWSSDAGKKKNVHNLLLWHGIRALKKAGVRTLDLGGINTDFNPGIARFKLGVGGRVVSLSGAWTKGPRWKR